MKGFESTFSTYIPHTAKNPTPTPIVTRACSQAAHPFARSAFISCATMTVTLPDASHSSR